MKIIVLMKQVANKDALLRINKDATWIEEGDLSYEVNESDAYALEEALRLKEKHGGKGVVCSMGRQRVKAGIKDALAPGALDYPIGHQPDTLRDAQGHHGGQEERDQGSASPC